MRTLLSFAAMLLCNVLVAQPPNKALNKLFHDYQQEMYVLYPMDATFVGDNRYNDLLPVTFTDEHERKVEIATKKYLSQLLKFRKQDLNKNDKLSYDVFKWKLESDLEGAKFKTNRIPISQFRGIHIELAQIGSGTGFQPFKTVKDYDDFVLRAGKFTTWADSIIVYFRKGIAEGIVLPKALIVKLIPQVESFIATDPTKSTYYGPVNMFPANFSEADKQRLTLAYTRLIADKLTPAFQKLTKFLKEEYLPAGRTTSGMAGLPNGKNWYAYNVKTITTTDKTPDEIFDLGLSEVKRIRGEMEKVKDAVGYKGTLNEFLQYLRTDRRFFPYKTADEVLEAYRSIEPKIAATLNKMFLHKPKTPFEIRQTEAFRAASAAAQYYPGLADGSRAGIFYVPIVDPAQVKLSEALFIHEAIPGHHYQVMLQMENKELPEFRRNSSFTAYIEGWGLYAESLGKELGLYTDPYQYMSALASEISRASRMVVDPGLHAKGWTREQAIQYLLENSPRTEQSAIAEIERYMAIPGQAVAYKIGALKMLELRAKYTKQLGSKFNIAEFHHEVLKDGALPLALLEQKLDAWAKGISKK